MFQLLNVRQTLMQHLSANVDNKAVFDFLKLAADDPTPETRREAYWMIIFIYLKKGGIDISQSFEKDRSREMLQTMNVFDYNFDHGFLEKGGKRLDLTIFNEVAQAEIAEK